MNNNNNNEITRFLYFYFIFCCFSIQILQTFVYQSEQLDAMFNINEMEYGLFFLLPVCSLYFRCNSFFVDFQHFINLLVGSFFSTFFPQFKLLFFGLNVFQSFWIDVTDSVLNKLSIYLVGMHMDLTFGRLYYIPRNINSIICNEFYLSMFICSHIYVKNNIYYHVYYDVDFFVLECSQNYKIIVWVFFCLARQIILKSNHI